MSSSDSTDAGTEGSVEKALGAVPVKKAGAGAGAARRRGRALAGLGSMLVGGFLGAATGTLLWLLYARIGEQHATIAALAVGFAAGLGVRLMNRAWGLRSGLVAAAMAAVGIAGGELLSRLVVPSILAEETGLPLALVQERLGVLSVHPMDLGFYVIGLYFAYRVASLPPARR